MQATNSKRNPTGKWRRWRDGLGIALLACTLGGCETLNPITLGVGLASYAATGKGLADHAIGRLTKSDCNILDGILSAERDICEPLGSTAARSGFRGLFAAGATPEPQLQLSERPVQPTPAVDAMRFSELEGGPSLRLTDEFLPALQATPQRVATRDAALVSGDPL